MDFINVSLLKDKNFWRAVFVEFLGTTLFLFLVTGVLIDNHVSIPKVSFAIGLAIAILAHVFGPISGGHFNPAITLGTIVTGDSEVIRTLMYTVAQLFGGISGSAITYGLNPPDKRNHIDKLRLASGYSVGQGFIWELLLTCILVLAFLASSSKDNNRQDFGFANPLAVGLAITMAHLVGVPFTGSGINPARAFGPSVILNAWQSYHWIYWIGPLCGGLLAALVYRCAVKHEMGIQADSDNDENRPLMETKEP